MRAAALVGQLGVDCTRIAVAIADDDDDEERAATTADLERAQAAHKTALDAFKEKRALAENPEVIELFPQVAQYASLDMQPSSRC